MINFRERGDQIIFEVIVQPRAGRSQVVGELAGALKIRIAAPPVEGRANDECERFLADLLGVKRGDIQILSGATGRKKTISARGLTGPELAERLIPLLSCPQAKE